MSANDALHPIRLLCRIKWSSHQVIQAQDGQAEIALARQTKPNLTLLDIQLAVMGGYAVDRELQQNRELRDVPIVAVTSYAMVGDREQVLAAGCVGYLEKLISIRRRNRTILAGAKTKRRTRGSP